MADIQRIIRIYQTMMRNDKQAQSLAEAARDMKSAEKYAERAGDNMMRAIKNSVELSGMSEEEAKPIVTALLNKVHNDAVRIAQRAQRNINERAGNGLGTLAAEFDKHLAETIAEDVAGKELTDGYIRNRIIHSARKAVDDTIAANARAHEDMGLVVHITRTYDDVGLHDGKDQCEWCLERCGEWDNYEDAYNAGAFERHPGCGCIIDYHVGKTHTWANGSGGWNAF